MLAVNRECKINYIGGNEAMIAAIPKDGEPIEPFYLLTIYGYKNSTAEAYAKEKKYQFVALDAESEPTTTTEPTATNATTTTTAIGVSTTTASTSLQAKTVTTTSVTAVTITTTSVKPETVTATNASTTTAATTTSPAQPEFSFGDPTGDGKADTKDASAILGYYAYISTGGSISLSEFIANET